MDVNFSGQEFVLFSSEAQEIYILRRKYKLVYWFYFFRVKCKNVPVLTNSYHWTSSALIPTTMRAKVVEFVPVSWVIFFMGVFAVILDFVVSICFFLSYLCTYSASDIVCTVIENILYLLWMGLALYITNQIMYKPILIYKE